MTLGDCNIVMRLTRLLVIHLVQECEEELSILRPECERLNQELNKMHNNFEEKVTFIVLDHLYIFNFVLCCPQYKCVTRGILLAVCRTTSFLLTSKASNSVHRKLQTSFDKKSKIYV